MKGIKGIQGRVKLPCVQCMHLLIPRSIMGLLCRGSYLSLQWQRPLLVPWGPGLLCKDVRTSYSSLVLFSVWCLRHQWVHFFWSVDGTDACKGLLRLVSGFHLGLSCGLVSCRFVMLCVHVSHNVCIMLGSSLIFLAFFVIWWWEGRIYHIYFITTQRSFWPTQERGNLTYHRGCFSTT